MRSIFRLLLMVAIIVTNACSVHVTKVPPGQAKKTAAPGQMKKQTGTQSAKPYAPGQRKKS